MIVRELLVKLGFRTNPGPIRKAGNEVERFKRRAAGLGQTLRGVNTALLRMASGYLGIMGVMTLGRGLVRTIATFETLQARLKTITGSTEAAAAAFQQIRDFAKNTPFELEQVTEGFIKMKLRGMDVSTAAMTKMGDVASAFGRDLEWMVERVGMALRKQNEAFVDMGITSEFAGKKVTLSFEYEGKVFRETIGNNAKALQKYLEKYREVTGKTGAMADQMGTFNGMMSNLKDALAEFAYEMGEAGLKEALKDFLLMLGESSGAGENLAQTFGKALAGLVRGFTYTVRIVIQYGRDLIDVFERIGYGITSALTSLGLLDGSLARTGGRWRELGMKILEPFVTLEDMIGYLQGRPSVIGSLIDEGDDSKLNWFEKFIKDTKTFIEEDWPHVKGGLAIWADEMGQGLNELQELFLAWVIQLGQDYELLWKDIQSQDYATWLEPLRVALRGVSEIMSDLTMSQLEWMALLADGKPFEAFEAAIKGLLHMFMQAISLMTNSMNAMINLAIEGARLIPLVGELIPEDAKLRTDYDFEDDMRRELGEAGLLEDEPTQKKPEARGQQAILQDRQEARKREVSNMLGGMRDESIGRQIRENKVYQNLTVSPNIFITMSPGESADDVGAAVSSHVLDASKRASQDLETSQGGSVR